MLFGGASNVILQFSSWTGFIHLPSLVFPLRGLSIVSLFFVFLHLVSMAAIDLINGNLYCQTDKTAAAAESEP